ncbi:MAG TPA: helix-turn-helix domain-containing protein [Fimbriimonadaceae bacterium]|nr:helix-turn-helix domain-containing protein [Fimbriimonadaceae bacterium]HRJ33473.1 helix-turn-helix domain-containing protein [Fimbriimonadaceae bacterium]
MSSDRLFPGQVERLIFSKDQIACIASPVRAEVYWAFPVYSPRSISEVAGDLGKSQQTVHYHVVALVQAGLLLAVAERKRHARIEKLYVRSSVISLDEGPGASAEYLGLQSKAFSALMRSASRDVEIALSMVPEDLSIYLTLGLRRRVFHVTPKQLEGLRDRIFQAIMDHLAETAADPEEPTLQIQTVGMFYPTHAQIRRWKGRTEPEEQPSDDPEDSTES